MNLRENENERDTEDRIQRTVAVMKGGNRVRKILNTR